MYGLKQAPKLWFELLAQTLRKLEFRKSTTSESLFVRSGKNQAYVVAYAYYLLVDGTESIVEKMKRMLSKGFVTYDLGACVHYLGIKIDRSNENVFLSQSTYASQIMEIAGITSAKAVKSPLPISHALYEAKREFSDQEREEMKNVPYRTILGSLLYLATRTRPNLCTAVLILAKYQEDPGTSNWCVMKHFERYVKGTLNYGIKLSN